MEQKRTLWILIAAGLFLCLVFGAAYFMSKANGSGKNINTISLDSPELWVAPNADYSDANVVEKKEEPKVENITEVPNSSEITQAESQEQMEVVNSLTQGLEYPEAGVSTAIAQVSDKNDSMNIYQTSETSSSKGTVTTTFDFTGGSNSVATVSAANKAAEDGLKKADSQRGQMAKTLDESTSRSKEETKVAIVTETPKTTVSVKSSTTVSSEPKIATSTVSAPKTTTTTATTTKTNSYSEPDRFWVQAASYSSKKKADEARSILDENQVQCEVFTYEMNGTLYYRVRVGPYTTKTEATYWKNQVDSLEQFADAGTYIVNSSAPIAKAN